MKKKKKKKKKGDKSFCKETNLERHLLSLKFNFGEILKILAIRTGFVLNLKSVRTLNN